MIIAVAALIVLGILLAAPADERRRLQELLPRGVGAGTASDGVDRRDRDETTAQAEVRRRAGAFGRDREAARERETLWAIGAVENCAHLLKVGMTPHAVLATLSRSNEALRPIFRAVSLGQDPGTAIAARSQDLPPAAAEVLAGMAAVWTVSERSGAPAADMILRYAAARRERLDAERERRIAMAGPRATVRVLSWLPLIGIGLGLLIGVDPMRLVTGLPGQLSISAGLLLYGLGRWWMLRMMRRAEE